MKSHYTNTKLGRSKPSKRKKLFKFAVFSSAISLSLAAIYTIISFIQTEEHAEVEVAHPYGTPIELTNSRTFMQAYLSVNCNEALMERTQTIRVAGQIISQNDNNQNFVLIKKRPDRMLFTVDRDLHEMTFGVSNDTVWRRIRAPQHEDLFARAEGIEAQSWLEQRRFFDRIISASLGQGTLAAIEIADWQGKECLKVSMQDSAEETVEILVSPQTMLPIAELQHLSDGTSKQTLFSDYRVISGMPIPFNMKSSFNGEAVSRIRLNSASINTGVLSSLFDIPESLLQESSNSSLALP